jgi:transposase-like protein
MRTFDAGFEPPFCPRPGCVHHGKPDGWTYRAHGFFERKAAPHRIRRFKCESCRRTFSTQTFDTTYWLKRPDLQRPLHGLMIGCAAFRQGARMLEVAASTLERQGSRLGRHCLLFQQLHGPKAAPSEPLVLDGLVTFEYSQYWPFELNLLIGQWSHFIYGFTESELRRSGSMREDQELRRTELEKAHGRPHPGATARAVEQLLRLIVPPTDGPTLHTDEHAVYPQVARKVFPRVRHFRTSSRAPRTHHNPLFPANLADLLIRHSSANHKRETIAFSKRRQGAVERKAVFQVWRNFIKKTSERKPRSRTPAHFLALTDGRLGLDELLHRRLFPSLIALPSPLDDFYWRRLKTRQIPNGTEHRLKLAV